MKDPPPVPLGCVRILEGVRCVDFREHLEGGMGGNRGGSLMNTPSDFFSIF